MFNPGTLDRRITLRKLTSSAAHVIEVVDAYAARVGVFEARQCVIDTITDMGGVERSLYGETTKEYTDVGKVWANADFVGIPKEGEEAGQMSSINKVRFTIRYRSDIDATWRIFWDGEEYEIEGIRPQGRKAFLIIDTRIAWRMD